MMSGIQLLSQAFTPVNPPPHQVYPLSTTGPRVPYSSDELTVAASATVSACTRP